MHYHVKYGTMGQKNPTTIKQKSYENLDKTKYTQAVKMGGGGRSR